MKKITLLIIFAFLFFFQGNAQVVIGSGNIETSSIPFEPYYGYSYTQSVYLASEIYATGTITGLQWYYSGTTDLGNSQELVIYLAESTRTDYADTDDWEPIASFTEVYSGGVTVTAGVQGWTQIVFDTPFVYAGTGNLIIALEENMADYDGSNDDFYTSVVTGNRSIYYFSDGTNPDPASPPTASGITDRISNVTLDGITQSCPNPANLAANAITDTSAELSWTQAGSPSLWNIEIVESGTTPTGVPTHTGVTNPYTVNNLTAVTGYDFYVQADCDSEVSGWSGPFSFTTECSVFTPDYLQEFTTIPADCWEEADSGDSTTGPMEIGAGSWVSDGFLNNGFSGAFKINLYLASKSDWIISPQFDLTGGPFQVEFDFGVMDYASSTNPGTLGSDDKVEFFITTDSGATWTSLLLWDNTSVFTVTGEHPVVDLTSYSGETVQFAVLGSEGTVDDTEDVDVFVDNFQVRAIPSCPEPIALQSNNVTSSTAELSWTESGEAIMWNIEVVESGATPTGTPTYTEVTNPYTVSNLTAVTSYDYYVQADCNSEVSGWSGPFSFTTECGVFTPDYLQEFTTIPADCWEEADSGDETTGPMDLGAGSWLADGYLNNGTTGAFKINLYVASKSDWIISPQFDLTGGPFQVEFDFGVMDYASSTNPGTLGSDDKVEFFITTDSGVTWTSLLLWDNTSVFSSSGEHPVVDLTAYSGETVQFAVLGSEGTVNDPEDIDVFVDNFQVRNIPTCQEPTDLNATNLSLTSTEISWTENGTSALWNIEYGEEDFVQGDGTIVNDVTSNPYTLTGLTENTSYQFYVQTNCGTDGLSSWTGPFTFLTGYCESVPSSNDGEGVTNVTLVNTDFPSLGDLTYEDHTATSVNVFQGIDTNLEITFATGFTYNTNVWIDFNDDLVFDEDELVYQGESTNANPTTLDATFTMPATATLGEHRMRIGTADFGQTTPNPCYSGSYGVTLDFTVNIEELDCTLPEAEYSMVTDCDNDQIFVDVIIMSLGDAAVLNITNTYNSDLQPVTETGTYQVGPVPFNEEIKVFVASVQNSDCTISSPTFILPACPPANDNCINATAFDANADETCTNSVSGTLFGATASSQTNDCPGTANDDVWFSFEAVSENHAVTLSNIVGSTTNLELGIYEGADCDNLTNIGCMNFTNELIVNDLIIGDTYYIRVYSFNDTPFQDVTFDICVLTVPPQITTNDTEYTEEELVIDVLINSPCSTASNITKSTGTDFGDVNGIAYFERGDANFPFESGIVMTTGDALLAGTPDQPGQSEGGFSWPGDADLEAIINEGPTENASIIEFDFVPQVDEISFNFIFAAEEYGTFQCGFSDAFAFLLTDVDTGVTTNLAVVPNTTLPVSVFTIRDDAYNGACPSSYPELFDAYYNNANGLPQLSNPTTFAGRTVPLTAMSAVTPGANYHIKLVIADDGDRAYDSAVFLEAGSFFIGNIELGDDFLQDTQNAGCDGQPVILDLGEAIPDNSVATWYTLADGIQEPIPGENGQTLEVTEPGTYIVEVVYNNNFDCFASDQIIVEFYDPIIINDVSDLAVCVQNNSQTAEFDLTENAAALLDGQTNTVTVSFYETNDDAEDAINVIADPTAYMASTGTIVYVRLEDENSCYKTTSFALVFEDKPALGTAPDVEGCDSNNDGTGTFNLTDAESDILGGATGMTVSYYTTQADADASLNAITGTTAYESILTTIYVRVETSEGCYETTSFALVFADKPVLGTAPDVESCDSNNDGTGTFNLTDAESDILGGATGMTVSYYTTQSDSDASLNAITTTTAYESMLTTIYVRVETTEGCYETTSFELVFSDKPVLGTASDLLGCDSDNDGSSLFNLTFVESEVLGGLTDMTVSYYASQSDADNSINELVDTTEYESVPTTIYVRVENSEGCYETTSFELALGGNSPIVSIDTSTPYEFCPTSSTPVTIIANADNFTLSDEVTISWWHDGEELEGENGLELSNVLEVGTYTIQATSNFSSECMSEDTVEVVEVACIIPQGISPNNDNKNDSFDLSDFDVQSLEIYNRYGRLVYSKTDYTNEWSGQSKDGDELPVGTYYYVMKYQGNKVKAAWVYINREQ